MVSRSGRWHTQREVAHTAGVILLYQVKLKQHLRWAKGHVQHAAGGLKHPARVPSLITKSIVLKADSDTMVCGGWLPIGLIGREDLSLMLRQLAGGTLSEEEVQTLVAMAMEEAGERMRVVYIKTLVLLGHRCSEGGGQACALGWKPWRSS
jgi:hypothetical protein